MRRPCASPPQSGSSGCSHDEDIGQGDKQEGDGEDRDTNHKQSGLVDPGICTGQSHPRKDITIEHTDFFAPAEGELEDEHSQLHGQDEPQHQTAQGQSGTKSPAHHEGVTQRVADGHGPVMGHDGQQNAVSAAQEYEEERLGTTARHGDEGFLHGQDACQSQRGNGGRVADLQSCHVGQEEIRGGAERTVNPDDERNGEVAADADQVRNQEGHENQHLYLGEFGAGVEVEVNHSSLVCILHVVNASGLLMAQALPPEDR